MSHLPFLTIVKEDDVLSDGTLDPDSLRSFSDRTASGMSSTSATSNLASTLVGDDQNAALATVHTPRWARFPLIVIGALGLSAVLNSFVPEVAGFELATISRSLNEPWQIVGLVSFKILELYTVWSAGLDYYDFASFYLLYSAPSTFLLAFFYSISPTSIVVSLAVDLIANTIPFLLFQPLEPHNISRAQSATLAHSAQVKASIALLAAAIYAVIIYLSLYTWLPVYLVSNFSTIRTLEYAHSAQLPWVTVLAIPLGLAASQYLFVPSIFYARSSVLAKDEFDPKSATLSETVAWNFGLSHWGRREEIIAGRTTLLVVFTLTSAVGKIFATIEGAEAWGALGWAAVFVAAEIATGLAFVWVGDV